MLTNDAPNTQILSISGVPIDSYNFGNWVCRLIYPLNTDFKITITTMFKINTVKYLAIPLAILLVYLILNLSIFILMSPED